MDTTETMCARHPDVATRLRCSECDTPICPRCSIDAAVGQKCPVCAKQPRSAVPRGKPRQFVKGGVAGGVAAGVLAFVLPFVWQFGVFSLLATAGGGYAIGRAVRWGAEGSGLAPFRNLAIGLGVLMVVLAALVVTGSPLLGGYLLMAYPAAAYGAYMPYR